MNDCIKTRLGEQKDIPSLYQLASDGRHGLEQDYFETAFAEQDQGKRIIVLAFQEKEKIQSLKAYVHLNFHPRYIPFQKLGIPEIQDLFVSPDARGQGVATRLIRFCEGIAADRSYTETGLGVGVTSRFGAAQRLYTKMGYKPDGAGVVFDRDPVQSGDFRPIDDRLCLMMVRQISKSP